MYGPHIKDGPVQQPDRAGRLYEPDVVRVRMRLRAWRRRLARAIGLHRLSQATVARELGIHWVTWSKWETGRVPMPAWLPLALEGLEGRFQARRPLTRRTVILSAFQIDTKQGRWPTQARVYVIHGRIFYPWRDGSVCTVPDWRGARAARARLWRLCLNHQVIQDAVLSAPHGSQVRVRL